MGIVENKNTFTTPTGNNSITAQDSTIPINISIVVPVYNEADNLENLYTRLTQVMDAYNKSYEIILTNDGSRDNSQNILEELHRRRPKQIKIIDFMSNFGQHMAIVAGFEIAKGEIIVTLDADLQNPPEEIPKLIKKIEEGYDLVSGVRQERRDTWFRRNISKLVNKIRALITNIKMTDHGCMLRAYKKNVIDLIVAGKEAAIFIPALAYRYASNPTEISVEHAARHEGKSKYKLYDLIRLNFDLMTGYSLIPLQVFTLFGFLIAILSILFVIYLFLRRLFIGPEVEGLFTLFAIMFFLAGILLMGMGITGEYIGRIYQEVRQRPRFVIRKISG
jgi:undecaprenyl-phosphate 4-deoxy-4-formamido-L-arabinose transferase